MFNKNVSTVLSFLALASIVASSNAADMMSATQSPQSNAAIDVQACDKPYYPERWIDNGTSGNVVMDVLVAADGTVLESKVVQSSGYRRVDNASKHAVESCKAKVVSTMATPSWSRLTYAWVIE
jgi:TonB family protein